MVLTGKPDTPMSKLPSFDVELLRKMELLDAVFSETLRLHPPIHTVMRKVVKDLQYKDYNIPKGHFLCGSMAHSQTDEQRFPDNQKFDPSRFMSSKEDTGEWTINGVDIAQKSAKSHYLPFGAGRHRCIGEAFAAIQIKTIVAIFLREFDFELYQNKFPAMDFTSLIVVPQKPAYMNLKPLSKK
jgi:sterol 14-demethylase